MPSTGSQNDQGHAQLRSTAWRLRSSILQTSSAARFVDCRATRGAHPASSASCQRAAQRHQRSPGFNPGKPNAGFGVERSLPWLRENARKSAVNSTHTACSPMSSELVLQHPSLKKPVSGSSLQDLIGSPSTLCCLVAVIHCSFVNLHCNYAHLPGLEAIPAGACASVARKGRSPATRLLDYMEPRAPPGLAMAINELGSQCVRTDAQPR